MIFELITYTNQLLQQVGLSSHRKNWFWDLFAPCVATDLCGSKDEYVRKCGDDMIKPAKISLRLELNHSQVLHSSLYD